jgi:DNA-binding CsgD family transcriptional regulator
MSTATRHLQAIHSILEPLQQALEINYFTYWRYQQGEAAIVSSDPAAAEIFLNDKQSTSPLTANQTNGIVNWQDYCSEDYFDYISNRYNSSHNGLTFVLRHSTTEAEHISINTQIQADSKLNEIKTNPKLVKQLIRHIRNQVNFRKDDFNLISIKKDISNINSTSHFEQEELIKLNHREYIVGLNGPTYITRTEKGCLLHLLQLKTSKEMAMALNCTVRTVECHLSSLRRKLGITKRHHFYQVAYNNFISPTEIEQAAL